MTARWIILVVSAVGLLAVGTWTIVREGHGDATPPAVVQARLDALPMTVGPWVGRDNPVSVKTMKVAEAEAYLSRTYEHETTKEQVAVLVMYGTPGALGAHTPEVCYGGAGYKACGKPARCDFHRELQVDGIDLWTSRFEKKGDAAQLDVWWGWGVEGLWGAADDPRASYARHSRIYKIYASRTVPAGPRPSAAADPTVSFLRPFLQAATQAVFAPEP